MSLQNIYMMYTDKLCHTIPILTLKRVTKDDEWERESFFVCILIRAFDMWNELKCFGIWIRYFNIWNILYMSQLTSCWINDMKLSLSQNTKFLKYDSNKCRAADCVVNVIKKLSSKWTNRQKFIDSVECTFYIHMQIAAHTMKSYYD